MGKEEEEGHSREKLGHKVGEFALRRKGLEQLHVRYCCSERG